MKTEEESQSNEVKQDRLADFLYEVGILTRTTRSGFGFLLSGKQNVAEHTTRTVYIALSLASQYPEVSWLEVLLMAQFHDSTETRISDLNHVHQKYVTRNEAQAQTDLLSGLPFEKRINELLDKYHAKDSLEAMIVKDADNIELLLALRENDQGNPQVKYWSNKTFKRLRTEKGIALGQAIMQTDPWNWWQNDTISGKMIEDV